MDQSASADVSKGQLLKEQLVELFMSHHGARVVLKSGDEVRLRPRTLNVFGHKDAVGGETFEGVAQVIPLGDIEGLEAIRG